MAPTKAPAEPNNKLRSSEPDLKIVLEYKSKGKSKKTERWVYSSVLASHSKFIDVALSVDMKEKQSKEIVFPDTTPQLFDLAIQFIEDPLSVVSATSDDATQLLPFFHKYEFSAGLKTCDHILSMFFKDASNLYPMSSDKLSLLVETAVLVELIGLKSSTRAAADFLVQAVERLGNADDKLFNAASFDLMHLKKLHPYFKTLVVVETLREVSEEEKGSGLFPRLLLEHFAMLKAQEELRGRKRKKPESLDDGHSFLPSVSFCVV